ncbi:CHAT domain-containing protein [Vararia minispora EC-137]|uniref:CHAT domain-containing protein n=1 Tax=Vararia minispora EC-137 TaxID=1314806 RepID=A0ACB8Q997_9AGAM|nr:CHAT domain-containing protein [Vararia minispora EC-137]
MTWGVSLWYRYEHLKDAADIDQSVSILRCSVKLATPDADRSGASLPLLHLGNALRSLFYCFSRPEDMDEAVEVLRQAVQQSGLEPNGAIVAATCFDALGTTLHARYTAFSRIQDLEDAISTLRYALDTSSQQDVPQSHYLSHLGFAMMSRFRRLGEATDLEESVNCHWYAENSTPEDHPDKPTRLSNLGIALRARFDRHGSLQDLDDAIVNHRHALELLRNRDLEQAPILGELGNDLLVRYLTFGEAEDIEHSVAYLRNACDSTPENHLEKPGQLSNLSYALRMLYIGLGERKDLEEAIVLQKRCVDLPPNHSGEKSHALAAYGATLQTRFEMFSASASDLEECCRAYQRATDDTSASPIFRLTVASGWASFVSRHAPLAALAAYNRFMALLPHVVWLGQDVSHRFGRLAHHNHTTNAVAAAIAAGDLVRAVEWFEEGRNVVWGQFLRLRSPLDDLRTKDAALAAQLQDLTDELRSSSLGVEGRISDVEGNHRRISAVLRYEEVLGRIRLLCGFEDFLRPRSFTDIASAARGGPVIIVNVYFKHSDALVLCPSGHTLHIPLLQFTLHTALKLRKKFRMFLGSSGIRDGVSRAVTPHCHTDTGFVRVLGLLWALVVRPILQNIEDLWHAAEEYIPHVTRCATGPLAFLPLHAAGSYGTEPSVSVSDFVVSSYTTNLSALLRDVHERDTNGSLPSMLVVSQPNTPGQPPLAGVAEEAEIVVKRFEGGQVARLDHDQATVATVLGAIQSYRWVHLACHGVQDARNRTQSAFELYDGKLTIKHLMETSLDSAELAFLSACQTATGDDDVPEEAVHLAAGMLAAGYRSVVGTMWSIRDSDAPIVADRFYEVLLSGEAGCGAGRRAKAAYALHEAVMQLRRKAGEKSFVQWVPFIHLGV